MRFNQNKKKIHLLSNVAVMPGGLLQETENRRISQISDLKSGHGCLEIELVISYKRVFETFTFN